jgi:hypothetical protein
MLGFLPGHRLLHQKQGIADHVILAGIEALAHRVMDELLQVFS